MSVLRFIGRLLGFKGRTPPPGELEQGWQTALQRYRWATAQVREASSPEELEVAHKAWQAAQADLQWLIRLAKRDQGIPLRSVSETHRAYQGLLHRLRRAEGAATPARRRPARLARNVRKHRT